MISQLCANTRPSTLETTINEFLIANDADVYVSKTTVRNWISGNSRRIGRGPVEGEPLALALAFALSLDRQSANELLTHCGYRTIEQMNVCNAHARLTAIWNQ